MVAKFFTLVSFEAAETTQQTVNAGKNTEVKQFECGITGMAHDGKELGMPLNFEGTLE
jgi:hypothetical protein